MLHGVRNDKKENAIFFLFKNEILKVTYFVGMEFAVNKGNVKHEWQGMILTFMTHGKAGKTASFV